MRRRRRRRVGAARVQGGWGGGAAGAFFVFLLLSVILTSLRCAFSLPLCVVAARRSLSALDRQRRVLDRRTGPSSSRPLSAHASRTSVRVRLSCPPQASLPARSESPGCSPLARATAPLVSASLASASLAGRSSSLLSLALPPLHSLLRSSATSSPPSPPCGCASPSLRSSRSSFASPTPLLPQDEPPRRADAVSMSEMCASLLHCSVRR